MFFIFLLRKGLCYTVWQIQLQESREQGSKPPHLDHQCISSNCCSSLSSLSNTQHSTMGFWAFTGRLLLASVFMMSGETGGNGAE